MTQQEQQKAAKKFSEEWKDKGYEKGESQKFWLDLLCNVYGIKDFSDFITFEDQVKLDHTSFIDGYIPGTKVLIEQKSIDKDLRAPIKQSDGTLQNPFQQAKRYITELPVSKHPKWVITCNFKSFLVYDMEQPNGEPEEILLKNLEKEFYRLSFITNRESEHLKKELEISKKAGEIIGEIYDAILAQYKDAQDPSPETYRSLNMLCVRIVFCLYAEDSGIFGHKSIFGDYLKEFDAKNLRQALLQLFTVLDQKPEERDPYLEENLAQFPYVNGGLFTEQDKTIPPLTEEIKLLLVNNASSDFDWSEISPTIFGAIFESTLNPQTRRSGGMHYTSIENIHKVIDPLFLDGLKAEFEAIKNTKTENLKIKKCKEFHKKLGKLKFLDPACGSGNFLTETYLSLRRLGNECIKIELGIKEGDLDLTYSDNDFIQVQIHQFYGIEINDFAAVVAKTALWIAESQMLKETAKILNKDLNFLPLKTYANIVEANSLKTDWQSVVPKEELSYILGNPPFVGARVMSESQKKEVFEVWQNSRNIGNADYVSCWFKKAADFMQGTDIKAALVSTNSITQGEQVAIMWKPLFEKGIKIDFAYRTFRWDSEANVKAHVHCVIIGFSCKSAVVEPVETTTSSPKYIYLNNNQKIRAKNINSYLLDAPNVFIESRATPLCNVNEMGIGNKPIDDGNYLFKPEEMQAFIKEEPKSEKYFHPWYGSDEFINNRPRYCLWLGDCSPAELRAMHRCLKKVENVRAFRLASKSAETRKIAEKPARFHVENMPKSEYIIVPRVSSERRRYVPIGYLHPECLTSDSALIIPNATLYDFGILTSNVHNAWMRAVCGRLEMRYRYSKDIVYNNFVWPEPLPEQKEKIEQTAQAILDARAMFPDSSLADLYDETTMPPALRKAHQENDKAVMAAYNFPPKITESECVAKLFELYEKKVNNQ